MGEERERWREREMEGEGEGEKEVESSGEKLLCSASLLNKYRIGSGVPSPRSRAYVCVMRSSTLPLCFWLHSQWDFLSLSLALTHTLTHTSHSYKHTHTYIFIHIYTYII